MHSSKPLAHHRPAVPFSWNFAAQGVALAAAFLFVSALVCGAI
ncbi:MULTISPECIES: hypothetical protein [unclassified Rhizobium]|nr:MULTISPECIES: hypothetical protein [unclassified Rhizobium]